MIRSDLKVANAQKRVFAFMPLSLCVIHFHRLSEGLQSHFSRIYPSNLFPCQTSLSLQFPRPQTGARIPFPLKEPKLPISCRAHARWKRELAVDNPLFLCFLGRKTELDRKLPFPGRSDMGGSGPRKRDSDTRPVWGRGNFFEGKEAKTEFFTGSFRHPAKKLRTLA